jgi:hypothetical protein
MRRAGSRIDSEDTMTTTPTSHDTAGAASRRGRSLPFEPRLRRRVVWALAGVALLAGIVLVLVLGPNKDAPPERLSTVAAQEPEHLVKAPLPLEARRVAVRFIQTAVARKNLEEAWTLVGPNLRGGMSRERWLTGENPVVPYPIDELEVAPYKIDESYTKSALLEVALLPRKGAGVRAQVFFLELKRLGSGERARWVVDNWVPRASAVVPR